MNKRNVYNNFFDSDVWDLVLNENKELLIDFLTELRQEKKSKGTIYQYEKDIRGFLCFVYKKFSNKSILELSKKDFRKYSIFLTDDCNLSSARHNRILSAIRSWLNYCENDDELDYLNNAARKVKGLPKEPVREIYFLTDNQIEKLKNKLIEQKEFQKAALLAISYDSCARRAEIAQVEKFSFYDENRNNTNKVIGKRRKIFSLIYFDWTKECVKLWLNERGDDNIDSLWIIGSDDKVKKADAENIYNAFMYMRRLLAEIEGKETPFNVHSLRHSGLQNLSDGSHYMIKRLGLDKGFPIEKLKLIANHTDISTTSGYIKDNSIDELEGMFNIKIKD